MRAGAGRKPADPLQVMLLDVWQSVLGIAPIGIDESFARLGGNRDQLEQMLTRAETVCGQSVPPDLRRLDVTVEELGARLLPVAREAAFARRAYIARNVSAGATREPLFFFHGDYGGGGLYCLQLAVHLGRDQPLYAIAPHGLDGEPLPPTIEAMAADRLELLHDLRPTGPYRLAGHCNGAIVAFEMARQLLARGERVERLVLVTPVIFSPLALPSLAESRRRLMAVSPREVPALVRDGLLWRARSLSARLHSRRASRSPGSRPPLVAETAAARDRLAAEYSRRMRAYWPDPYPGTVDLLYTRDDADARISDLVEPWPRLAERVEARPIPGNHLSCITVHVRDLARSMRQCLDQPGAGSER
jgi:thioesterase domain-containing protein